MTTNRPLTDEEIAAIAERCRKATPGPWEWCDEGPSTMGVGCPYDFDQMPGHEADRPTWLGNEAFYWDGDAGTVLPPGHTFGLPSGADGDFIAKARTDIPRLLQEVVRLKAEVRSLRNRLEGNS